MQLLIKLYTETPRIGIIYPSEYQAIKMYEQLIEKHLGETFHLSIEIVKGLITLKLRSIDGSGVIVYKDLEFKSDQLKRLETYCKPDISMELIHVFNKSNGMVIPKIRQKAPEFLKIKGYEIVY
jgi:hypothetical protein